MSRDLFPLIRQIKILRTLRFADRKTPRVHIYLDIARLTLTSFAVLTKHDPFINKIVSNILNIFLFYHHHHLTLKIQIFIKNSPTSLFNRCIAKLSIPECLDKKFHTTRYRASALITFDHGVFVQRSKNEPFYKVPHIRTKF